MHTLAFTQCIHELTFLISTISFILLDIIIATPSFFFPTKSSPKPDRTTHPLRSYHKAFPPATPSPIIWVSCFQSVQRSPFFSHHLFQLCGAHLLLLTYFLSCRSFSCLSGICCLSSYKGHQLEGGGGASQAKCSDCLPRDQGSGGVQTTLPKACKSSIKDLP